MPTFKRAALARSFRLSVFISTRSIFITSNAKDSNANFASRFTPVPMNEVPSLVLPISSRHIVEKY